MLKKILSILLVVTLMFSLVACGSSETKKDEITQIKFSQSMEELKKLDNSKVEIKGFMSMLSPLNGELIYLMNIPLQNCPFCVPNTTTLSNTIAVQGKNIEFTAQPVKIVGDLVFDNFSDSYGYQYDYRIENAEITVLDENEISENMKVYYTVNQEGFLEEVYFVLGCIDQVAFYREYGIIADTIDEYGEIPFEKYESIIKTLEALNSEGKYDDFIELTKETEKTRLKINESIKKRAHEEYMTYRKQAESLFAMFSNFINKYEF